MRQPEHFVDQTSFFFLYIYTHRKPQNCILTQIQYNVLLLFLQIHLHRIMILAFSILLVTKTINSLSIITFHI